MVQSYGSFTVVVLFFIIKVALPLFNEYSDDATLCDDFINRDNFFAEVI